MQEIYSIIRTIHLLAGSLWIGEVVVINFVLIPVLSKYQGEMRKQFLISIFPKIFTLASILSSTVVVTGVFMVYHITNGHLNNLFIGRWGVSILIGGSLGIILTAFHFFMEHKLANKIGLGSQGNEEKLAEVHLKLKIVPRLGLMVITIVFLLMINASHGLF